MSNTTKLILLDSVLQEDRVLAPQGPSSISAVAELVLSFFLLITYTNRDSDDFWFPKMTFSIIFGPLVGFTRILREKG